LQEFLNAIKDWPVIIQGALGSALFALILFVLQKVYAYANHQIALLSKKSRIRELTNERLKIGMSIGQGKDKALFASPMLYRMSRPFLKSLIWLVLGLLFSELFDILSVVGYLGSIYYLLNALDVVAPYECEGNLKIRLKEIEGK